MSMISRVQGERVVLLSVTALFSFPEVAWFR